MNFKFLAIPKNIEEPELFRKMIQVSVGLHIAALLFFGLKAAMFPREAINLDPVIRVDMVGLPEKTAQLPPEMAKPEPAAPAQPEPKPVEKPVPPKLEPKKVALPVKDVKKPEVVLHPSKPNIKKDLEKIREIEREERRRQALAAINQQVASEDSRASRQAKVAQLLKGNVVSPGTALHGVMKSEFNEYIGQIHSAVREHWNLPEWLQNDSLKATVVAYIDYRGVVIKRVIERSSGDQRFDAYALKAVDDASPFPKPPAKFVDVVRVDGIILGFPQ